LDAFFPKGRRYFIQTRSLVGLQAETIAVLIERAQVFTSPFSAFSP
jgi:hypothetical protein